MKRGGTLRDVAEDIVTTVLELVAKSRRPNAFFLGEIVKASKLKAPARTLGRACLAHPELLQAIRAKYDRPGLVLVFELETGAGPFDPESAA